MEEFKSELKKQYHIWLRPSTKESVEATYRMDNCKSHSEFIDKAIQFYCGYVLSQKPNPVLPVAVSSVIEGKLETFENRIAKLLFKQAVELDIVANILAYDTEVSEQALDRLRGKCVADVKRTNGQIGFKDAVQFQKTV